MRKSAADAERNLLTVAAVTVASVDKKNSADSSRPFETAQLANKQADSLSQPAAFAAEDNIENDNYLHCSLNCCCNLHYYCYYLHCLSSNALALLGRAVAVAVADETVEIGAAGEVVAHAEAQAAPGMVSNKELTTHLALFLLRP